MSTELSPGEREAMKRAAGADARHSQIDFRKGWLARREYSKQREEKLREVIRLCLDERDAVWACDPGDMDQRYVANAYASKLDRIWSRLSAALAENGDTDD